MTLATPTARIPERCETPARQRAARPRRLRPFLLGCLLGAPLAACGSARPDPAMVLAAPDAVPLTKNMNDAADAAAATSALTADRSQSRVLAYVNGEVVSYRDVLLKAPPQLATMEATTERESLERATLYEILQERILQRAAIDAGIDITRDELDRQRARKVRDIEKTSATLEAYLRERGESRREFDEEIRRTHRITRYIRAAVGVGNDASVRVRAITDTYVSPREMRAYYDRNLDKFRESEVARVRVLEIRADLSKTDRQAALAEAKASAEAALARLRSGEDWVPVYRDLNRGSAEPDPDDGLLEIKERGKKSEWIESFAFNQPRGTLSDVVVPKGATSTFYVMRAEGFTPERQRPYDEVQPVIQNGLSRMRYLVATYEVVLSLLEEAAITPRQQYDDLRAHLTSTRRALVTESGL